MNLTKLVLKRPVSTALVLLGIVVFGLATLFNFDLELTPDIEMPMMLVNTVYPGASPESIEALITKPVEDAGETLSGVENCMSHSYENYSIVAFTYDYDQNMNDAYTDLSAALDALKLPEDAKEPVILQMDVNAMDTMRAQLIEEQIETHEAESGQQIRYLAFHYDSAPLYCYNGIVNSHENNLSAWSASWNPLAIMNLSSGRGYAQREYSDELYREQYADQNWDLFSPEQVFFHEETAYIAIY